MVDTITFAAGLAECEVEIRWEDATGLPLQAGRPAGAARADRVRAAPAASRRFILSGGGADANVFNERGLQCVNLANGMTDIHTPDERIAVADLEEMVEVTLALVDVAREVEHAA